MATIGEALNRRADIQKRIKQLEARLRSSVITQEGDEPPEDPYDLLRELLQLCDELEALVAAINHANAENRLSSGETVTHALARREVLSLRSEVLRGAIDSATNRQPFPRLTHSEIRMVRRISVSELQRQLDDHARRRRELDTALQEHNWTTTLAE